MKILVTGTSGQVGHELLLALAPLGVIIGADRARIDLASPESIVRAVRDIAPDIIVNPAAYTAVDLAESQPDQARAINAVAPGVLGEEARRLGAWLVHYSTDYVFDGDGTRPWREDDPTSPVSVYGLTKRDGELAVAASGCMHLVLRTSWVYGLRGKNFLVTMARLAAEREELRVVDDQIGAPTTSVAIARATAELLGRLPAGPGGIYHMTCAGSVSWCGFARALMNRLPRVAAALGQPAPASVPRVTPIRSGEFPTPVRRPANSVLDNSRLARDFGVRLPRWEQALDELLEGADRRVSAPATS